MSPDPVSLRARLTRADVALYRHIRTEMSSPALDGPLRVLTRAGEHAAGWYALGLAGAAVQRGSWPRWRRAMAGILVTELLNTALKFVFRRRRPALEDLPVVIPVPASLSFPSAHASTSFCAARAYGPLVSFPLLPIAAAVAFSRVYFGVHYPSDVVVGAALGTVTGGMAR